MKCNLITKNKKKIIKKEGSKKNVKKFYLQLKDKDDETVTF